jgi:hypothetical protein
MNSFSDFQWSINRRQAMGSIAAGLTSLGANWEAFDQTGIRVLHSPEKVSALLK